MANPEAIIADDEEQLIIHLKSKLADLWPELTICGEAQNGLEQAINLKHQAEAQVAVAPARGLRSRWSTVSSLSASSGSS